MPSVSVPVLSMQIVSTPASDSTALRRCTSAPERAIFTAASANVRLVSRIRPSGTIEISPAVAVSAAWRSSVSWMRNASTRAPAKGTAAV